MGLSFKQIDFSRVGITKIELISFLYGEKPAILINAPNINVIRDFFTEFSKGERIYFSEMSFGDLNNIYLDKRGGIIRECGVSMWVVVSKRKNDGRKLIDGLRRNDLKTVGKMLGYPKCCVEYHVQKPENKNIQGILKRTKGKPSYYLNNIFNFESRLKGENTKDFKKINSKDINADGEKFYHLISHIPCSYNCAESIKIGKKTLKVIEKNNHDLAIQIKSNLKKPILFFDDFYWIVFNGFIKNNVIFYESISTPNSLIDKKIIKKISGGDRLRLKKNEVVVSKERKEIGRFSIKKFNPMILDFQE